MAQAGILHEDDRVELLDGEVVEMAPIGSRHAGVVLWLSTWFSAALAGRALVNVQSPVRLSLHSEPEPDIALLRPRPDFYTASHPAPGDVLLLIEVADTSLVYDRDVKLPRYAAAGISEVWIIDLEGERALVYRGPSSGSYRHAMTVERGAPLSSEAFPDLSLWIEDILR